MGRGIPVSSVVFNDRCFCADAGAKASNLKKDQQIPEWFVAMVDQRKHCRDSGRALYGILRKRWVVCG